MSKRLNLREFQQGLIDRLQATDTSEARVSTLGVQIAGRNWLVEMVDIAEVLPLTPLIKVPFTKPWFRGVAQRSPATAIAVPTGRPMTPAGGSPGGLIIARFWLRGDMPLMRRCWSMVCWVCAMPGRGGKARVLISKPNITMSTARPGANWMCMVL